MIKELYETTELTITDIALTLGLPFSIVYKYIRTNYSAEFQLNRKRKCYRNSKLGDKNPAYGKKLEQNSRYIGQVSDCKGYLLHVKPDWYTGRVGSHHVFVHHLVICQHLGITEIPIGYCVHHKDHNPLNNEIENLELMTHSEHIKLHSRERRCPCS